MKFVRLTFLNLVSIDSIEESGFVTLTEELVAKVQAALVTNGVAYALEVDLSPKFVIGYVDSLEQHPNADKLKVCQVNIGEALITNCLWSTQCGSRAKSSCSKSWSSNAIWYGY